MPKINCKDLTGKNCDFVAEGETAEETKTNFYKHGAESPIHKEMYQSATDEQKKEFGEKVDKYLASQ